MPSQSESLRIAWLVYRGNPHCGGQGVYTRYLARELTELGHQVDGVLGPAVPRARRPGAAARGPRASTSTGRRTRSGCRGRGSSRPPIDLREFAIMCARRLPRAVHVQRARPAPARRPPAPTSTSCTTTSASAPGLLGMMDDGLAGARHAAPPDHRRPRPRPRRTPRARGGASTLRRWYGFLEMQMRVARAIPRLVTVSESSRRDIVAQMGVRERPAPHRARGRRPADLPPACPTSRACPAAS